MRVDSVLNIECIIIYTANSDKFSLLCPLMLGRLSIDDVIVGMKAVKLNATELALGEELIKSSKRKRELVELSFHRYPAHSWGQFRPQVPRPELGPIPVRNLFFLPIPIPELESESNWLLPV